MEKIFDQASIIKLLKDGLKKPKKSLMWTLKTSINHPQDGQIVSITPKAIKHFRKVIKVSNTKSC